MAGKQCINLLNIENYLDYNLLKYEFITLCHYMENIENNTDKSGKYIEKYIEKYKSLIEKYNELNTKENTGKKTETKTKTKTKTNKIKIHLSDLYDKINDKIKDKTSNNIKSFDNLEDFKKNENIQKFDIKEISNVIFNYFPQESKNEITQINLDPNHINEVLINKIIILKFYKEMDEKEKFFYIGPLLEHHCLNMIKFIYKNSENIELFHEIENLYTGYEDSRSIGKEDKDFFIKSENLEINTLKLGETDFYTQNDYVMVLAPKLEEELSDSIKNKIHKIHTYRENENLPLERLVGLAFYEYWSMNKTDSSSLKTHSDITDIVLKLLNQESITNEDKEQLREKLPGVGNDENIKDFITNPNDINNKLNKDINNPLIYILLVLIENHKNKENNKIIEKVENVKNILELLIKKNKIKTKITELKTEIKDKFSRAN